MTSAFVQGIGVPELLIVLGIVLVIFGPKRLPEMGRSIGRGLREFKQSIGGGDTEELDLELPTTVDEEPGHVVAATSREREPAKVA